MHLIIATIWVVTVFLAFVEDYLRVSDKMAILAGYLLVMILLPTTKSVEHTADALNYMQMFHNTYDPITEIATEPTYIYLSRLILACGGTIGVLFFLYAIITIPIKLSALYHLTPNLFTALVIYIPVYFELHDMVQIRAAAAAGLLLFSLIPLAEKRYLKATLLMVAALMFHYSSIVFFPFLLIGNRKLTLMGRYAIGLIIPIFFLLYLMKKDFISFIPSFFVEGKLDFYQKTSEKGDWEMALLYKNVYFMVKCMLLYFCLYYYEEIVNKNRFAPILISLFIASILSPMLASSIPIIASRISDLYGIVDCIVFTFCLYFVSPPYFARIAVTTIGLYMLVYNMFVAEYFF